MSINVSEIIAAEKRLKREEKANMKKMFKEAKSEAANIEKDKEQTA